MIRHKLDPTLYQAHLADPRLEIPCEALGPDVAAMLWEAYELDMVGDHERACEVTARAETLQRERAAAWATIQDEAAARCSETP